MAEYIEKEAVVHHFMTKRQYLTKDLVMDAAYEVSKFPAADVAAVVHGRWEAQKYWKYENKHSIQYHTNRCSLCHCDVSSRLLYNYCPNCGARMDGE